jgi:exodeoxyribonuclease V alpha subunit
VSAPRPPQDRAPKRAGDAGSSARGARTSLEEADHLEGTIERVTYHAEDSLYTVLRLVPEGEVPRELRGTGLFSPKITAVGPSPKPSEGLRVRLNGRWTRHKTHGLQFEFKSLEVRPPNDPEGLIKYLASKTFQGIGPTTARRIVDALGTDALAKIRNDPACLSGVQGLTKAAREGLAEKLQEELGSHALHAFLLGLGLGPWQVEAVVQKYGTQAEERLRRDPYLLATGIEGIGFQTADKVARELGLAPDGIERRRAALVHALGEASSRGHCFLPGDELIGRVQELLGLELPTSDWIEAASGLVGQRELLVDRPGAETSEAPDPDALSLQRYWLPAAFESERRLSENLANLLRAGRPQALAGERELDALAESAGLELDPKQRDAVLGLLSHPVALLTGGPGVGKTTVMRFFVDLALNAGARVALAYRLRGQHGAPPVGLRPRQARLPARRGEAPGRRRGGRRRGLDARPDPGPPPGQGDPEPHATDPHRRPRSAAFGQRGQRAHRPTDERVRADLPPDDHLPPGPVQPHRHQRAPHPRGPGARVRAVGRGQRLLPVPHRR